MTDQPGGHPPTSSSIVPRSWIVSSVAAAIMVGLVLLGVGMTTAQPDSARTYWMWLVPVFGVVCAVTAYVRTRHHPGGAQVAVVRQILHWFGIAVAVGLDFWVRGTGEEAGVTAGYTALLLLALGCYLAGVHLDWLFVGVGLLLTLTLILVVKANQYVWVMFVVGSLGLVALIGVRWLWARMHRK